MEDRDQREVWSVNVDGGWRDCGWSDIYQISVSSGHWTSSSTLYIITLLPVNPGLEMLTSGQNLLFFFQTVPRNGFFRVLDVICKCRNLYLVCTKCSVWWRITWPPCVLCTLRAAALWSMLVHFGGQAQTHTRPLVLGLGLHGLLILGDNPPVQVLLYFLWAMQVSVEKE